LSDATASTHLLVVAHGSRRAASNEEVKTLVDRLRASQGGRFGSIEAAFLELAEPSIEDGLAMLAGRGASHIVVMPYFLAAGSHVSQDIPEMLAAFRAARPNIELTLKPHVGSADGMGRLILDMATT
jgi:sirohydrochlorin ferrochelatase